MIEVILENDKILQKEINVLILNDDGAFCYSLETLHKTKMHRTCQYHDKELAHQMSQAILLDSLVKFILCKDLGSFAIEKVYRDKWSYLQVKVSYY